MSIIFRGPLKGASTVKYTEKCSNVLKIFFLGQTPKSSSKILFQWNLFSWCPLFVVKYSNLEYQNQIFKLSIKNTTQDIMAKYSLNVDFMTLDNLKLGFFSYSLNLLQT